MRTVVLLVMLMTLIVGAAQAQQQPEPMLAGTARAEALQGPPFARWFAPEYAAYQPDSALLTQAKEALCDAELVLYMGTWCGDSRREAPRLLRALQVAGFPPERLTIVCLLPNKQGPAGEATGQRIHRVPTLIVRRGGRELGRIIESPVQSLEADLVAIVQGAPYTPRYAGAEAVSVLLAEQGAAHVQARLAEVAAQCAPRLSSPRELASLGNVLWAAGDADGACAVFEVNAQAYPQEPAAWRRLAEAYRSRLQAARKP